VNYSRQEQVIEFYSVAYSVTRWIGIDLNTTGHVAVVADPDSGKVLKLGKTTHYVRSHSSKNCTKLWKEGKLWKLKKIKSREQKSFKAALNKISWQIVSFAESLGSGIKFEKLFSDTYSHRNKKSGLFEFSFENGSFFTLQRLVERRAHDRGIPVLYVNPACTSKRCSRCGAYGRRSRKHFECPHCGYVAHADVNAAFNIATRSTRYADNAPRPDEVPQCIRISKKQMISFARIQESSHAVLLTSMTPPSPNENLLAVLE
jgi:putative transposase